jgi:hypothetical protein
MSTDAQICANRENAQHSTGPTTESGKAASCQNNFRHGMTGAFRVLPHEDQDEFDALLCGLRAEHQPATLTESLLVQKMAQHYWLSQRALSLQDECATDEDLTLDQQQKQLALFLRYQTTNDRAFHKCLNDLLKLRAEKRRIEIGFESQARHHAEHERKQAALALRESAEKRRQELHKWAVLQAEAKLNHQLVLTNDLELDSALAEMAQAKRRQVREAA